MYVPRGEVSQRTGTRILVLDVDRAPRRRRQRRMFAPPWLDGGLLIDAEHIIPRPQRCTFPAALIQIDDPAGFAGKLRVAGKDPTAVAPGAQCVLAKPAPERCAADPGNDAAGHRLLTQLRDGPASQGKPVA